MSRQNNFNEPALPLFEGQELIVTGPGGAIPSYIKDHRKRLRDRFSTGGAAAMPDYEMLELVLFRSLPRCDVKPVANRLLEAFGDFNRVLSASADQLTTIRGVGNAVAMDLKVVEAAAHRLSRARIMQRHVLSSWDALLDYCRTTMAHRTTEQFRILFLDTKNILIADEEQAKGTVDHVPVYPREVVKRGARIGRVRIYPGSQSPVRRSDTFRKRYRSNAPNQRCSAGLVDHIARSPDHRKIGPSFLFGLPDIFRKDRRCLRRRNLIAPILRPAG